MQGRIGSVHLKVLACVVLLVGCVTLVKGQHPEAYIRRGNRAYGKGEFKEAELEYRKALNVDSTNRKATFNLADAQYEQKKYAEAEKLFSGFLQDASQPEAQGSDTWYNLGNTYFKQEKYEKSVEAYREALRRDPSNRPAKYNLSEALRKLAQQQSQNNQKNQDNQDQQDKDKPNQDGNNNQQQDQQKQSGEGDQQDKQQDDSRQGDKQNQQGKDQNRDGRPDQQGDKQQDQSQQRGGQQKESQMTQEEAAQLLKALENQEGKLQAKILKARGNQQAKSRKSDKDW